MQRSAARQLSARNGRCELCGGQREYALFARMLNPGARVHEVLNLKTCDVRLESPHQVRFVGKGNKVRLCPIWPRTAKLIATLIATNRRCRVRSLRRKAIPPHGRARATNRRRRRERGGMSRRVDRTAEAWSLRNGHR